MHSDSTDSFLKCAGLKQKFSRRLDLQVGEWPLVLNKLYSIMQLILRSLLDSVQIFSLAFSIMWVR